MSKLFGESVREKHQLQAELERVKAERDYFQKTAESEARECNKLEAQRDELLAALKDIIYGSDPIPRAKAAIAKAESEAAQ